MEINKETTYNLKFNEKEISALKDLLEISKTTRYLPDHLSHFVRELLSILDSKKIEITLDADTKIVVPDINFEHVSPFDMTCDEKEKTYRYEYPFWVEVDKDKKA